MPVKTQQVMNKLGLEATEEIVWQGWQPGGEYTKNITLKNVDFKTKKLKYRCVTFEIMCKGAACRLCVCIRNLC